MSVQIMLDARVVDIVSSLIQVAVLVIFVVITRIAATLVVLNAKTIATVITKVEHSSSIVPAVLQFLLT